MYILSPDEKKAMEYRKYMEQENEVREHVRNDVISVSTFELKCGKIRLWRFEKIHFLIVQAVHVGMKEHYILKYQRYRVRDHTHIPSGLFMLGYVVNALDSIYCWYRKYIQVADKNIFLGLFKKVVLHPVSVLISTMKRYLKHSGEHKLHQDVIGYIYTCLCKFKRVVLRECLRESKRNDLLSTGFQMKMLNMGDFLSDEVIPKLRALGDFDLKTKEELKGIMPGDEYPYPFAAHAREIIEEHP